MKTRCRPYLLLCAILLLSVLTLSCRGTEEPEIIPVALPTFEPPQAARALTAEELQRVEEFSTQQQAIGQDWDQFHRDFDQWRAGLTVCDRASAEKALQEFAVGFNAVTELARDLPRSEVVREFADSIISAAEDEEIAFRQLRDQWQPNGVSLFEKVEERRVESARAQREVEDLAADLSEDLGEMSDPAELRQVEELFTDFTAVGDALNSIHDEFSLLTRVSSDLGDAEFALRLIDLIQEFELILNQINRLPLTQTVENEIETLDRAARTEDSSLKSLYRVLVEAGGTASDSGDRPPAIPGVETADQSTEVHVEAVNGAIGEVEAALREANRAIDDIIDGSSSERLEDVATFLEDYQALRDEWDAFHDGYNEWRRIEGGCDQGQVIETLAQYKSRISEIGRRVRELPQSGLLLAAYGLLVEAAEREEGAFRTLQNTWQPFTVDSFIAVDLERSNASGLRREASISIEELRDRANGL